MRRCLVVRSRRWVFIASLAVFFLPCDGFSGALSVLEARLGEVVDGDTIRLSDGRVVRYIGVDAPEVRRRSGGKWVYDPEPWSEEATRQNKRWTEGSVLRLEFDPDVPNDRHGRLLAYVFADGVFVNEAILRVGLARVYIVGPHTLYRRLFKDAEAEAVQYRRGLWSK